MDIDVNKATVKRVTPLMASAHGGHYEVVKVLLAYPSIESKLFDFDGKTALFYSIPSYANVDEGKWQSVVELLLRCPSVNNHLDENCRHASYYTIIAGFSGFTPLFRPQNHALLFKIGHACYCNNVNVSLQTAAGNGDSQLFSLLHIVRPFISGHNDDDFSRRLASGRARAIHETFRSNIRGKRYTISRPVLYESSRSVCCNTMPEVIVNFP